MARKLLAMNNGRKKTKAIIRTIARGEGRSRLFWWMVENHDRIAAAAGKRIYWKGVCSEAAVQGLTDANGNAPSTRTARETWRKAKHAVAEALEREAARPRRAGRKPPSRMTKDWRPAVVRPIAPPERTAGAGLPLSSAKPGLPASPPPSGPPLTEEEEARAEAALAGLREQFREKDWYLNPFPPKRKAD